MSLDVYLEMPGHKRPRGSGIFIREDGQMREITRAEWDAKYPDREPFTCTQDDESNTVFEANVTHNLNRMAGEAGIYKPLWRPDEIGVTHAKQLIEPLRAGLALMRSDPARFVRLNPENGWGSYERFVPWVADYLAACEQFPDATVRVSR